MLSKCKEKLSEQKSLDQLILSIFLFKLKLDSLLTYIFIDFNWL